jgi:TIR domain/Sel1 repeat
VAHDVFISYSSKDKPAADAACAVLESKGIRCWIAPRDIIPGADWSESIINALNQSRAFVLVFSSHANSSPQIKREVERAVNQGLPVIPLRIEDVAPAKSLEYFISTPHWLDAFSPPLERHLNYLVDVLGHILENKELPPQPAQQVEPGKWTSSGGRYALIGAVLAIVLAGAIVAVWKFRGPGPNQQTQAPVASANTEPAASAIKIAPPDPLRLDLVTDCDRLASSPEDPQRPPSVGGTLPDKIDIVPALAACNSAMRQYPDVVRFVFQAGRVATVQKDYAVARQLYEKAAAAGSAAAMAGLGNLYYNGNGVPKDYDQARTWYAKAVAAGYTPAAGYTSASARIQQIDASKRK